MLCSASQFQHGLRDTNKRQFIRFGRLLKSQYFTVSGMLEIDGCVSRSLTSASRDELLTQS